MEKYQFIKVPVNLFYLMDANCTKVLITLIQMAEYYGKGDWFYRSMNNLEDATGLSENVIRAALDTLYQEGIVSIITAGTGKGKHPNRYKVNTEKFREYEDMSLDDIISGGVKKIETAKYRTGHYTPSYMRQQTGQQTGQRTGQKVSTNIDNIDNIKNINNIDNTYNKSKEENISNTISLLKDKGIKEYGTPLETPGDGNKIVGRLNNFDWDSALRLPEMPRRLEVQYYHILKDLPILEKEKSVLNEDCFLPETLEWTEDQTSYTMTSVMLNWYSGGREKLAELVQGMEPEVTKDIITYLVLYCKTSDSWSSDCKLQPVYAV